MRELYDKICKLLTWYEHQEENPISDYDYENAMYELLVDVQNKIAEEYGY